MPRINDIRIRSGSTTPSAGDFNVAEPAWDATAGKLYVKNAAGQMVEVGPGVAAVQSYASTASFPGAGSSGVLYMDAYSSRAYRWTGSVYVEVGPVSGIVSKPSVLSALIFG